MRISAPQIRAVVRAASTAVATGCLLLGAGVSEAASIAPPPKQVATVNVGTYPTSLDPSMARSDSDRIVANALFAPLYRSTGPTGGLAPFLASGQPVVSNGGLRYTVRLRAARWSDGTSVSARDVKFAFDRARTSSPIGATAASGASANVVDARTIRFDLAAPMPWFPELLASTATTPIPSAVVKLYGKAWTTPKNIATSGPFRLLSTTGRSEAVLVPNDRWWARATVRLARLRLVVATPASATQLFRGGRLDAGMRDTSVSASLMSTMRKHPGFRTVTSNTAWYLFANTRSTALQSPAVRRGIALAIDRSTLAARTSGGFDQPLESVVPRSARGGSQIAPDGSSLLPSSGAPQPDRARAELKAGAWSASSSLDLWYDGTSPPVVAMAATVVANLAEVGVNVAPHPVTPQALDKVGVGTAPVTPDTVDLVLRQVRSERSDPHAWQSMVTCAAIETGRNLANVCDPSIDAAVGRAVAFAPFSTRVERHREVEALLTGPTGSMPVIPLVEPSGEYLVQPWVRNFIVRSTGLVDFERVYLLDH